MLPLAPSAAGKSRLAGNAADASSSIRDRVVQSRGSVMSWGKIAVCAACLVAICAYAMCEEGRGPLATITTAPFGSPIGLLDLPRNCKQAVPKQAVNTVLFAGRTVEFLLPSHWRVKEVPLPDEVRLVAGPGDVPTELRQLEHGFWIAYHRIETESPRPALETDLGNRLAGAVGRTARLLGPAQHVKAGGYQGLKQLVELDALGSSGLPRRATYLLVQTPWGRFEMLGVASFDAEDDVRGGLKMVLDSLRFHAPQPPDDRVTGASQPFLGRWKAQQGALHFLPGGRVRLEFDTVIALAVDHGGGAGALGTRERLTGRFTAQDDLIFITWDDGSQLNYRWRLHQGDLLLMDHTQQLSRLKRLFDADQSGE
jgi:hypothetical protein